MSAYFFKWLESARVMTELDWLVAHDGHAVEQYGTIDLATTQPTVTQSWVCRDCNVIYVGQTV